MINDGHDLLVAATTHWDLQPAVRMTVDLGLRLMRINLGLDLVDEQRLVELEETGGLKRDAWASVVKVTFDWDGISEASTLSANSEV